MKNVILVGYRGTGKTTVARQLAVQLGWQAVDADDAIEKLAGKTIKEIFADDGEATFRDLESQVVKELTSGDDQVLAMGGGAILRATNRNVMRENGLVFWLTADAETLFPRIIGDPSTNARRPNLTSAGGIREIENLLAERQDAYRAAAHHEIDTIGRSPEEVVTAIMDVVNSLKP